MKKKYLLLILCFLSSIIGVEGNTGKTLKKQDTKSKEWTVLATYTIPGKASGLAFDGTYLYSGLYSAPGDDNIIYKINPADGSYEQYCAGQFDKAYGLTYDGQYLWTTDRTGSYTPAIAVQFDQTGSILSQFELPATYMSGIAYDNGNFWVSAYYDPDGSIYKMDNQGNVLSQIPAPNAQPWDICMQDNDIWVADYDANMLYKIDQSGNILESHASENIKPSGVVFDGQYLWYCDGQVQTESKLYKIDLSGGGTPAINVIDDNHDYGIVTIGNTPSWNANIFNSGTADLIINGVSFNNPNSVLSCGITFPQTVTPGSSFQIPLIYSPVEFGPLNDVAVINSNDPVNPNVDITLTAYAVYSGARISLVENNHDFENIRINAFTRWFVQIQNYGDQNLIIDSISSSDAHFIVDNSINFPVSIATLDLNKIGIWFNPDENIQYNATISVYSNDDTHSPFEILIQGFGDDSQYPIGDNLWHYQIDNGYDNSPKAIKSIKDITGDEVDDIIVCSEDDCIRCFNGNSSVTGDVLWEKEIFAGSVYNQSNIITIKDIDSDGYQDIAVGTAWGDRSIIAISGKTGATIWKHDTHEYGGGGWVYQVSSDFDYNDDGLEDVLAATGNDADNTGPKRVYCLDAVTGNSIWETNTGGPVFSVLGVEDFNNDSKPDVVAGASNQDESQGKIYGIDGSNGNILWTYLVNSTSVWALLQLDDVNNDGINDIIAGDFSGNYYLINPVDGSVIYSSSIGYNVILRFEKMDDVNNDYHDDILVAHSGKSGIVIDGFTGAVIWNKSLDDKSWCVARINDVNGDAVNDVVIGTLYSNNYCYYLDGTNGDEIKKVHISSPVDAIATMPDITGDGSMEVVVGGRLGEVYCLSGGLDAGFVGVNNYVNNDGINTKNYPNPFKDNTNIYFNLKEDTYLCLDIYNINGQKVFTLRENMFSKGEHSIIWDGRDNSGTKLNSGIYFYELKSGNYSVRHKMMLVN